MINKAGKFAAIAASILAITGVARAETRVSLSTGVDYSSGDYGGDEETNVTSVPLAARITNGDWAFRVSVPYLIIDGPADIAEGDGDGVAGTILRDGTESGLGDTTIAAERTFRRLGGSNAYVELGARVRLPTGDDDNGLGVGETDYTVATELGTSSRKGGVYVSAGYRFLGDSEGRDRQDGAQAGVGGWLPVGERTRVGAFANWREATFDGNEDPASAGAYVSYRVSDELRVAFNAGAGLSDGSADYTTGVRFTWRPEALNR